MQISKKADIKWNDKCPTHIQVTFPTPNLLRAIPKSKMHILVSFYNKNACLVQKAVVEVLEA